MLLETIGVGGFSKVKLAIDKATGAKYAIKILKEGNEDEQKKISKSFRQEVNSLLKLKHPYLINLIDYSENGIYISRRGETKENVVYLVLELALGGELFDYVALTGCFSEIVARYYFIQLIKGIEFVHQNGFAHRDLKPENIFLDEKYNLKIADFGFSS